MSTNREDAEAYNRPIGLWPSEQDAAIDLWPVGPGVRVYTVPGCAACRATCSTLDRAGVRYVVADVAQDPQALAYVRHLGHLSAPVVVAGEQSWDGFRPDLLEALAGRTTR